MPTGTVQISEEEAQAIEALQNTLDFDSREMTLKSISAWMKRPEQLKELKKANEQLREALSAIFSIVRDLQSTAATHDLLGTEGMLEAIKEQEEEVRKGNSVPWREVRNDL